MAKGIKFKEVTAMPGSSLHTIISEKKENWEKKAKEVYDTATEMDIRLTGKEGIGQLRAITKEFQDLKEQKNENTNSIT